MSIFDKRVAFKPFEYPDILKYKDAINHSYWLVSEWNFIGDIHDFNVRLNAIEKNAIKNALLAISQIEVSVKRFWTKLGDRFPKSEFEQVGVTFGECHIDGTEILTPNGWMDLSTIKSGDEVLQYHPDSTFTITKINRKFEKRYEGNIHKFYKKTTATYVTPNHRMVFFNFKDEYKESYAKDLVVNNSDNRLPEAALLNNFGQEQLSFMDRLRMAIQADGKKPRRGCGAGAEYEITIKKPRKIKRLDLILENLTISFSKNKDKKRAGYYSYTIRIDDHYNYKNFDWVNLKDKTYQWCQEFVEELSHWDGGRLVDKKDCKIKFYSCNKSAIDQAQMVGVAAGYRTNIYKNKKKGYKDGYVLSFTENRQKVSFSALKEDVIPYSGVVRCVSVDSGAIITRFDGKTFIAGNSEVRHADAYSHLLQVLGLNDDFNSLLENPVIQGRIDYLTKYLKGASENSNENYTLTLTLFSIFIENVSLFSQFLIIKSFNKYMNILKDVDNVVQATQKEEAIHAMFGAAVVKKVQEEYPEWFNDTFYEKLKRACLKAYDAECRIIDWIFELGELSFLPKEIVKEFIKDRFNEGLEMIGGKKVFDVDKEKLREVKWFNDEIYAEVNTDFFHKKPVTYSKKTKAIKAEDIF